MKICIQPLSLREGLVDYVAMDVKNALSRYGETVGIPDFDVTPIERSIDLLLSGAVDYEFRTTVTKELHRAEDIAALAKRIRGARRYFLQGFVDSGDLLSDGLSAASKEEMEKMRDAARIFVPDRMAGNGMSVTAGRLREDNIYDYKFIGLSHNTLRGAAGGAVLLAELLCAKGYMD